VNAFVPIASSELSFFLGAWLGDGWADEADGGKRLHLHVRSKDFAEEFANAATVVLRKASRPYRARLTKEDDGDWYDVKVTSVRLSRFLAQPFNVVAPIIERSPSGFLRGFSTAEGNPSVSVQSGPPVTLAVSVCFSNTELEHMKFARLQLEKLGYHPTNTTVGYKAGTPHPIRGKIYVTTKTEWQFRLAILGEVQRFSEQIGFADQIKQDKIVTACALIGNLGSEKAADEWQELFEKKGRKWWFRKVKKR